MNKRGLLPFLILIILPACICDFPSLFTPVTESVPTEKLLTTENILITVSPRGADTKVTAVTLVQLHPQNGDLMTQINAEVQKATAHGQQPIVEFDASW